MPDKPNTKQDGMILSILIVFSICFLLCTLVGFPIILPDSRRYLGAAALIQISHNAPTLFPFIVRPLYIHTGPWAFVLVNCGMAAILSVHISKLLYRAELFAGIITSMITSMFLLSMTFVMMDIQVVLAVVSLYILIFEKNNIIVKIILGICIVSHNSSILITTITATILAIILKDKSFIKNYLIIFSISLLCLSTFNYVLENRFSPLPRHTTQFLVARLIVDVPEAMDSYIETYKDSTIAPFWISFREKYRQELADHDEHKLADVILWATDGLLVPIGKDNIAKEANNFFMHTLTKYPAQYTSALLGNFIRFFTNFIYVERTMQAFSAWNGYDFHDYAEQYFQGYKDAARYGAQSLEHINYFYSATLTVFVFVVAVLFNLAVVVIHLIHPQDDNRIFIFSIASFVFLIINAFVASNFGVGTSDGRFFVKPFWPFILNLFLYLEQSARKAKKNLRSQTSMSN